MNSLTKKRHFIKFDSEGIALYVQDQDQFIEVNTLQ